MTNVELYGIVLCGGKSSRMGTDKSLLNYHGVEQRYHLYGLLKPFCEQTFISYDPKSQVPDAAFHSISDLPVYSGKGPITGLLSAFALFPEKHMLLIGCDYPFLQAADISHFLSQIPSNAIAAAFYNYHDNCYEPVLAWYSSTAGILIAKYFDEGNTSLQKFLEKIGAYKVQPSDINVIRSIDTYEEYILAKEQMAIKHKILDA